MMEKSTKIYLAGHNGMVGSAIYRKLQSEGYTSIVTRERNDLDLTSQDSVRRFFNIEKPEIVVLAAAKVGGIKANMKNKTGFLTENIEIQVNVMQNAQFNGCKKLVFLGSSCIYPKEVNQPIKEEYLLSGKLEPTNEGYALSKIIGLKMAYYYTIEYGMKTLSLMPCNLYGTNDSFNLDNSHVLSALVRKFVDAKENGDKEVTLWGTGIARREFMHVDDFADALYYLLYNYDSPEFINVGTGKDISIKELSDIICSKIGYTGKVIWDKSMPDGTLLKKMDVSKLLSLGYYPKISLDQGIESMINDYNYLRKKGTVL
jgi:GDP-L-fucose synthase